MSRDERFSLFLLVILSIQTCSIEDFLFSRFIGVVSECSICYVLENCFYIYNSWHEGKLLETDTFIVFLRACLIVLLLFFFAKKNTIRGFRALVHGIA